MNGNDFPPQAALAGSGLAVSIPVRDAPVPVAAFDADRHLVAWSDPWVQLLGHPPGSEHGPAPWALSDLWADAHRRALQGETTDCAEDEVRLADGRVIWLCWHFRALPDLGNGRPGVLTFAEEVTSRKNAQTAARLAKDRLQQITVTLGIGLFEFAFDSGWWKVSDSYMDMLGIARDQVPVTLEGWLALLRPPDREAYLAARAKAMDPSGDGHFTSEVRPFVGGMERVMEIQSRVLFQGSGAGRRPDRLIGIIVDKTESRHLQEALSRAQRLETVGRLAGMVAHDFNNILTVILANLELAELQTASPNLVPLLRNAMDAAEMGAGFNKRLLVLAGGHPSPGRQIDVDVHLGQVWNVFQRVLGDEISFHFRPCAPGAAVSIDPAEIDGAILNLVINARDAQPRGGQIVLQTDIRVLDTAAAMQIGGARPGRFLHISVRDRGPGIPPDIVGRLGEPFFTTKTEGHGNGLGLTSVILTAQRAGGFVHITSAQGEGTDVSIYLPVLDHRPEATDAEAPEYPFGNGELVLVVEDDQMVREAALLRLEAIGYAVIEAGNADVAWELIEQGEPVDLVFSDVVMPGTLSGFDLVRNLRSKYPRVAVLLTSGHVSSASQDPEGLISPASILPKPYPLKALAVAVHAALQEAQHRS